MQSLHAITFLLQSEAEPLDLSISIYGNISLSQTWLALLLQTFYLILAWINLNGGKSLKGWMGSAERKKTVWEELPWWPYCSGLCAVSSLFSLSFSKLFSIVYRTSSLENTTSVCLVFFFFFSTTKVTRGASGLLLSFEPFLMTD